MCHTFLKNKATEISVDSNKNSFFPGGNFQQSPIAGIRTKFTGFDYIMSIL